MHKISSILLDEIVLSSFSRHTKVTVSLTAASFGNRRFLMKVKFRGSIVNESAVSALNYRDHVENLTFFINEMDVENLDVLFSTSWLICERIIFEMDQLHCEQDR